MLKKASQKGNVLILVLVAVIALAVLVGGSYWYLNMQKVPNVPYTPATKSLPTGSKKVTIVDFPKPVYTDNDYVTFAHYYQGYKISYPANKVDLSTGINLTGATSGNFILNDGDNQILIYEIYPADGIKNLNLSNISEVTECGEGGCGKFFQENMNILNKSLVDIGNLNAYKVFADNNLEKGHAIYYFIPNTDRMIVINVTYLSKVNPEIEKIITSFSLIPDVPKDWTTYTGKVPALIFKYPKEMKLIEDSKEKTITLNGTNGDIKIYYYGPEDPLYKYFIKSSDNRYIGMFDLESAYKAENSLDHDIKDLKFSTNAFTYGQGGDRAVRVVDPINNLISVYFYQQTNSTIFRMVAPLRLESLVNQLLRSVNDITRSQ